MPIERFVLDMRITLLLIAFLLCSGSGWAQGLSLSQVSDKLEKAQQEIEDIAATARLAFALRVGILPYSDALHGTYQYQKPDRHQLDFPDAPSYLKSVPSMFSWALPSLQKYDGRVEGPLHGKTAPLYRLTFSPKSPKSQTASIIVTVDAGRWRVVRQETVYKDGGSVLLNFSYRDWSQSSLLEKVSGELDLPAYRLKGKAGIELTQHKVNQGLKKPALN